MDGFKFESAESTIRAILESEADVVLLQETNEGWERLIKSNNSIKQLYPHIVFHNHWHRYGGLAALSKLNFHFDAKVDVSPVVFKYWYPAMRIRIPLQGNKDDLIHIVNLHLRAPFPSLPWKVGKQRLLETTTHIEKFFHEGLQNTKGKVLIVGDFNTHSKSQSCRYLCEQNDFVDVLVEQKTNRVTLTWKRVLRQEFDHILYRKQDFELVKAKVSHEGGSDHWPVFASFTYSS